MDNLKMLIGYWVLGVGH